MMAVFLQTKAIARSIVKTLILAFASALLILPLFVRRDSRGVYDKVLGLKVVSRSQLARAVREARQPP